MYNNFRVYGTLLLIFMGELSLWPTSEEQTLMSRH